MAPLSFRYHADTFLAGSQKIGSTLPTRKSETRKDKREKAIRSREGSEDFGGCRPAAFALAFGVIYYGQGNTP